MQDSGFGVHKLSSCAESDRKIRGRGPQRQSHLARRISLDLGLISWFFSIKMLMRKGLRRLIPLGLSSLRAF